MKILEKAKIITPRELSVSRNPVPRVWLTAAGILKGKKKVMGLAYQKQIRRDWEKRITNLGRLTA